LPSGSRRYEVKAERPSIEAPYLRDPDGNRIAVSEYEVGS